MVQDLVKTSSNDRGKINRIRGRMRSVLVGQESSHCGDITLQDEAERAEPSTDRAIPIVLSKDITDDTGVVEGYDQQIVEQKWGRCRPCGHHQHCLPW